MTESSRFQCRISSVGRRGIIILDEQGHQVSARLTGKGYHDTKPVAGDRAIAFRDGEIPLIEQILPRTNVLERTSPRDKTQKILAANVDRVLVIASIHNPDFNPGFVNRALAGSEWRKLPATLVLNKMDLYHPERDSELLDEINAVYCSAGYRIFPVSCKSGEGAGDLLRHIKGETVVMTGVSGSGKTSLANHYNPDLNLKIGVVNPKTTKGRHTTVAARLIPLEGSTTLIDTPGLKVFSIEHIPRDDLQLCFPEFKPYLGQCKFRNCLHLSEPGCSVKEALRTGKIAGLRYDSYRGFLEDTDV